MFWKRDKHVRRPRDGKELVPLRNTAGERGTREGRRQVRHVRILPGKTVGRYLRASGRHETEFNVHIIATWRMDGRGQERRWYQLGGCCSSAGDCEDLGW